MNDAARGGGDATDDATDEVEMVGGEWEEAQWEEEGGEVTDVDGGEKAQEWHEHGSLGWRGKRMRSGMDEERIEEVFRCCALGRQNPSSFMYVKEVGQMLTLSRTGHETNSRGRAM
eukprot:1287345-Prymnesium_polylepis.1